MGPQQICIMNIGHHTTRSGFQTYILGRLVVSIVGIAITAVEIAIASELGLVKKPSIRNTWGRDESRKYQSKESSSRKSKLVTN